MSISPFLKDFENRLDNQYRVTVEAPAKERPLREAADRAARLQGSKDPRASASTSKLDPTRTEFSRPANRTANLNGRVTASVRSITLGLQTSNLPVASGFRWDSLCALLSNTRYAGGVAQCGYAQGHPPDALCANLWAHGAGRNFVKCLPRCVVRVYEKKEPSCPASFTNGKIRDKTLPAWANARS